MTVDGFILCTPCVYVIRKLATQSDPTLTADVSDIQVAIEAIDDYLSLGLKKLKKAKKAQKEITS